MQYLSNVADLTRLGFSNSQWNDHRKENLCAKWGMTDAIRCNAVCEDGCGYVYFYSDVACIAQRLNDDGCGSNYECGYYCVEKCFPEEGEGEEIWSFGKMTLLYNIWLWVCMFWNSDPSVF